MFQTAVVEEIKTHIVSLITFFFGNHVIHEIMWKKNCRTVEATIDNIKHAHCMLDTKDYKHKLSLCNVNCSSITTVVAKTPQVYVIHILPLLYYISLNIP